MSMLQPLLSAVREYLEKQGEGYAAPYVNANITDSLISNQGEYHICAVESIHIKGSVFDKLIVSATIKVCGNHPEIDGPVPENLWVTKRYRMVKDRQVYRSQVV